jgi:hypothetical protein
MTEIIRWDGHKISKPGLYAGVPMESYHNDLCIGPSVSASGLWTIFDKSEAHYYDRSYLNPFREDDEEETAAITLGRASHHAFLGEQDFLKYFVIRPEELNGKPWNGNRLDCKDWLANVDSQGLTVLKGEQVVRMRGAAAALGRNPLVKKGALNGLVEHSLVWQDEETGVWIKSRPDVIPLDLGASHLPLIMSDLKMVSDVSDDGIVRGIKSFGYGVQGAVVGMGCRAVLGREMSKFTLALVESKRPHCVRFKTLKPSDIALGEQQVRAALRAFKRGIDTDEWPGPGGVQSDAEWVELDSWARGRVEAKLAQMAAREAANAG